MKTGSSVTVRLHKEDDHHECACSIARLKGVTRWRLVVLDNMTMYRSQVRTLVSRERRLLDIS